MIDDVSGGSSGKDSDEDEPRRGSVGEIWPWGGSGERGGEIPVSSGPVPRLQCQHQSHGTTPYGI
ncbi:hypothetical protein CULT_10097 [[Clostridium] ultunense Esp]|nr:hypothetical protein CULT_10097 [[Clostridium] ultunense Esp]